ncbi:serine/threonine protein kinase [Variovorax sp. JS1663]|uniref:serine/threonine protein kinase n=1 Tax=Variovorax sp. JS1663 TaxID=1851577 RepID=UPI001EDFD761|nr:serine/threonine-protein kinase [Variovorax sp. JS1663]
MPQPAYAATVAFTRAQTAVQQERGRLAAPPRHALPERTDIEGFQILRPLGEGGFGIVYLAWDPLLERHVALKEYMPAALAVRADDSLGVSMRSERHRGTFEAGLKSFLNEARLLASFDHPALLKVFRFWEAHGTAYMAMPYYEGPTLKEMLAGESSPPAEAQLREWLHPLLDALAILHEKKCLHRDISPDNILLTSAGPVLLDFGAARRVISDMTQGLTAVLKPGFAPIEQYGGVMAQGPWTDLYALAGVVYYAITGRLPPASAGRVVSDAFEPLAGTHGGLYGERFLQAIDASLALRPEARPQDVGQFRALIGGPALADAPPPAPAAAAREAGRDAAPAAVPSAPVDTGPETHHAPLAPAAAARARPRLRHAPAALLLLALAGSAAWWLAGDASRAPLDAQAAKAPSVVPDATVAAPARSELPPQAAVRASSTVPSEPAIAETPRPAAARVVDASARPAPAATAAAAKPPSARAKPVAIASEPSQPTQRPARTEPEAPPAVAQASRPQRCSDLVLKSSLEGLNPDEATFQKSQCR